METNSQHKKAVKAILYGHSCAMQLKSRLDHSMTESGPVSSYDLSKSIVDCFSNAISILSGKTKSEDDQFSGLSSGGSSPLPPQGSHSKKRKIDSTNSSVNWRDDSPNPIYYDGYLWRKYGQKFIRNSNHQRSYYRCSYNIDHNCGARKHEQKIKDNPPVYRTTYFGHHTCTTNHNPDAIFAGQDPVDDLKSAKMIRFGEDLDQEMESHLNGFSLSVNDKEDIIREQNMDQYREITSNDQDCQHVMKEDLSSPTGSYPPSSSSGSESAEYNSDLLFDNPYSWDLYDQFYFSLC